MNRNEINAKTCSGIIWWIAERRKSYLRSSIFMALIATVLGSMFLSVADAMTAKDMTFIFGFLGIFALVAVSQFISFLKLSSFEIEKCWSGRIIDTRRERSSQKKNKKYYIIADVNGKELEGRCFYTTYVKAEIGDEVVLFQYRKKGMQCVHREMP